MSNALFVLPLTAVAVTPSSTAAGAAAHVALAPGADFMGLFWRPTGTSATLTVDMGADVVVDTAALLNVAGAGAGTWRIDWATDAQGSGFGGGAYQTGADVPILAGANALASGRQAGLWLGDAGAPMTGRYFRLAFTGVASGAFQFARLVLGRRWVPERNFSFGGAFGVRSFGSVSYSDRAVLLRRQGNRLRVVGLSFPHVRRDEIEATLQPLLEQVADDVPLLLVTDPASDANRTRRIYFGHFEGDLGTIWRNAKAWEWKANLVSLF